MLFFKVKSRVAFECAARLAFPLLAVPVALAAFSARARADAPLVGVHGWTSGSQTFVRVRPSALTPPVAKLPSNTPVYVWGRFNDWYRVETHDHIFGWVHKEYVRAPHIWKVKVISHFKAKQASEQSAAQTLYGTPAELKAYHAAYGGSGAVKGLALKGIYVAPKAAPSKPVLVARASPKAPSKPVFIARGPKAPRVQAPLAASARQNPPDTASLSRAPEAMAPGASSLADAVRSWKPASNFAPPAALPPSNLGQTLGEASSRVQSRAGGVGPLVAPIAPSRVEPIASSHVAPIVTPRVAPIVAPSIQQPSNAPSRPLAPVFPGEGALLAPTNSAPRVPIAFKTAPKGPTAQQHLAAWQARKHAKEQHWIWLQAQKANAYKFRLAQAQKRAQAARQRRLWLAKQHQERAVRLASRKGDQRKNLGARVGLAPKQLPSNLPGQGVAPYSPDDLLKARDQFIKGNGPQNVTRNAPVSTSPGSPFVPSGLRSPNATPNAPGLLADLKSNLQVLLFGSPQQKTQTARDLSASSASDNPAGHGAANSGAPTSSSMPIPFAVAAPTRVAVSNIAALSSRASARGGSPRDRGLSRGGSPRDRARLAWNSGVANQALSYRGMPYVFGSASPSRGFDCSGLIYFLLRQRGLNPPRTAAGYRTYGTAVGRGHWQTGDLILFANTYKRGISHIGVYLKDGKFVHAASTGQGVRVDSLRTGYFASKYWGARRVK